MKTLKVNYQTIEIKKSMPIAYLQDNKVKTVFRTVKQDEKGFYITINKEKQYITKSDIAYKGVTTIIIEGSNAINNTNKEEKKATVKKEKKATKKATVKKVTKKKEEEQEKVSPIEYNDTMLSGNFKQTFSNELPIIDKLIIEYVNYTNSNFSGKHLQAEKYNFEEGISFLNNISTFKELQVAMITYFLKGQTKNMIRKMLEFGVGYKKLNRKDGETIQKENSYMNASSNNGKVTVFEIDEIFNSVIIDAYQFTFSKEMFNAIENVFTSIYFRVSNRLRKELGKMRNQTKVYMENSLKFIEETTSVSSEMEALHMANDLNIFNEEEMNIIALRVNGYKKNEIDMIVGQRTDRKFTKMKKKYSESIAN